MGKDTLHFGWLQVFGGNRSRLLQPCLATKFRYYGVRYEQYGRNEFHAIHISIKRF